MSTLERILEKKKSGEIVDEKVKYYESKHLGEKIEVRKKPVSIYMEIVSKYNITDEDDATQMMPMLNELIFTFCPMFSNPDAVKMAMEIYREEGAVEPTDLPEFVFDSKINEMTEIVEVINSFYDLEEVEEDIKN